MRYLSIVFLTFFLMCSCSLSGNGQVNLIEPERADCQLKKHQDIVGTWDEYLPNDLRKPPTKFVFQEDGTFRAYNNDGTLVEHRWQGHWAFIKNRLYVMYNDQTFRQFVFEDHDTIWRIDNKCVMKRRTGISLIMRLDGMKFRWGKGQSVCQFEIVNGRIVGRLDNDAPWNFVPDGQNTLRRVDCRDENTDIMFSHDLNSFLFKTKSGTRIGTRIQN